MNFVPLRCLIRFFTKPLPWCTIRLLVWRLVYNLHILNNVHEVFKLMHLVKLTGALSSKLVFWIYHSLKMKEWKTNSNFRVIYSYLYTDWVLALKEWNTVHIFHSSGSKSHSFVEWTISRPEAQNMHGGQCVDEWRKGSGFDKEIIVNKHSCKYSLCVGCNS